MGFTCSLKFLTRFQYQTLYKKIGSENELCTILIGNCDRKPNPNPKEVVNWKWVDVVELKKEFNKNPESYAPWFKIGLRKILKNGEKFKKLS